MACVTFSEARRFLFGLMFEMGKKLFGQLWIDSIAGRSYYCLISVRKSRIQYLDWRFIRKKVDLLHFPLNYTISPSNKSLMPKLEPYHTIYTSRQPTLPTYLDIHFNFNQSIIIPTTIKICLKRSRRTVNTSKSPISNLTAKLLYLHQIDSQTKRISCLYVRTGHKSYQPLSSLRGSVGS